MIIQCFVCKNVDSGSEGWEESSTWFAWDLTKLCAGS